MTTIIKKHIELVPYNPAWARIFARESKKLLQALSDNCLEIHHIGSTSVLGLCAKNIIDIIVVVKDPHLARQKLEEINIEYRGEYNIPLHYGFRKRGVHDFNIHVYEENHPEIELNLSFRDYLRAYNAAHDEYAILKTKLLQDESSLIKSNAVFTNYTLRKGDFIRSILKKTGYNRLRILKCNDETEWDAAKHYRNKYFFSPYGIADPYNWTFDLPEHAHLVLYQGVNIIGYCHLQFWIESRAAMRIIVTDENRRSQNMGSEFLILIENWLKALSIKSIHAESRASSLNFYLKNGYTEMPFDDPENHESDPQDVAVGKKLNLNHI